MILEVISHTKLLIGSSNELSTDELKKEQKSTNSSTITKKEISNQENHELEQMNYMLVQEENSIKMVKASQVIQFPGSISMKPIVYQYLVEFWQFIDLFKLHGASEQTTLDHLAEMLLCLKDSNEKVDENVQKYVATIMANMVTMLAGKQFFKTTKKLFLLSTDYEFCDSKELSVVKIDAVAEQVSKAFWRGRFSPDEVTTFCKLFKKKDFHQRGW